MPPSGQCEFEKTLERIEAVKRVLTNSYNGGPIPHIKGDLRLLLWNWSVKNQQKLDSLLPFVKQYLSEEWCFTPGTWKYLRSLDEHHPYFHTLRHESLSAFYLGDRLIFLPSVSFGDLRTISLIFRVWPLKVLLDIESDWVSRTTIFEKYIYHNIDLFGRRVERMACVRRVVHVDDLVGIVAGFLGPR